MTLIEANLLCEAQSLMWSKLVCSTPTFLLCKHVAFRSKGMDEAQMVQNAEGTIIANMRHTSSPTLGRGVAMSTDGGATFSNITFDAQLVASVCQVS